MYRNEKKQIQFAKELRPFKQWKDTPYNYEKTAITFFINELLYKTIREEACDMQMFDFIDESLTELDEREKSIADFPIRFLIKASTMFGFRPMNNHSEQKPFFNLMEGRFVPQPSTSDPEAILNRETSSLLHNYLSFSNIFENEINTTHTQRNELFLALLEYYKIHFNQLSDFKSHVVLHEILR